VREISYIKMFRLAMMIIIFILLHNKIADAYLKLLHNIDIRSCKSKKITEGTFDGSRPSLSSLWKLLYYDHRLGDKYWKVGGFTKKSPMRFG